MNADKVRETAPGPTAAERFARTPHGHLRAAIIGRAKRDLLQAHRAATARWQFADLALRGRLRYDSRSDVAAARELLEALELHADARRFLTSRDSAFHELCDQLGWDGGRLLARLRPAMNFPESAQLVREALRKFLLDAEVLG